MPDNLDVRGQNVVVTGTIAGESRRTAAAKLQDAGANVQLAVTGTTHLLVTGAKVGASKVREATRQGVRIVSWEDVWTPATGVRIVDIDTRLAEAAAEIAALGRKPVRQIAPQLAKGDLLPIGAGWLYEIKWDGVRGIVTVRGGEVTMQSRSGKSDYVEQFPQIVAELSQLPDCVIDGEIVVLDAAGASCFQSFGTGPASYVLFDMLEKGEEDMRGWSLEERRRCLSELIEGAGCKLVGVSPAFEDGELLLAQAKEQGLEGIVAKRRRSRYQEGARTSDWIKVKIRNEQEFVVVGWLPGEGSLAGHVGSWLLAVVHEDAYAYCGKVGTGGSTEEWDAVRDRLVPVADRMVSIDLRELSLAECQAVTWVIPQVVVQVAFQRWTADGRLWHPSWKAVRHDKAASDVVREPGAVTA